MILAVQDVCRCPLFYNRAGKRPSRCARGSGKDGTFSFGQRPGLCRSIPPIVHLQISSRITLADRARGEGFSGTAWKDRTKDRSQIIRAAVALQRSAEKEGGNKTRLSSFSSSSLLTQTVMFNTNPAHVTGFILFSSIGRGRIMYLLVFHPAFMSTGHSPGQDLIRRAGRTVTSVPYIPVQSGPGSPTRPTGHRPARAPDQCILQRCGSQTDPPSRGTART